MEAAGVASFAVSHVPPVDLAHAFNTTDQLTIVPGSQGHPQSPVGQGRLLAGIERTDRRRVAAP